MHQFEIRDVLILFEPHRHSRNIDFHIAYVNSIVFYMSQPALTKEGWFILFQTETLLNDHLIYIF